MKRSLLWFSIIILGSISCQQEDNTPPSNPTSTMTPTEQALVGKWYWDSTRVYNAGDLTDIITISEYTGWFGVDTVCTVDFRTTFYGGTTFMYLQYYDCIIRNGTNNPMAVSWSIIPANNQQSLDYLNMDGACGGGTSGYIRVINSTNFEVTTWGGSLEQGHRHYFHK